MTAVLLYAMRCLAEGDQPALRSMNFGPEEVAALRGLDLEDLYRVASLKAHCLDIRLERPMYWSMVAHLRRERQSASTKRELIEADAPLEMMRRLFGVSRREYTRLRRLLRVETGNGRPREPDEAVSRSLWAAFIARREAHDLQSPFPPQEYLALHHETGASLRAIWALSIRWSEAHDFGVEEDQISVTDGPKGSNAEDRAPPR